MHSSFNYFSSSEFCGNPYTYVTKDTFHYKVIDYIGGSSQLHILPKSFYIATDLLIPRFSKPKSAPKPKGRPKSGVVRLAVSPSPCCVPVYDHFPMACQFMILASNGDSDFKRRVAKYDVGSISNSI